MSPKDSDFEPSHPVLPAFSDASAEDAAAYRLRREIMSKPYPKGLSVNERVALRIERLGEVSKKFPYDPMKHNHLVRMYGPQH